MGVHISDLAVTTVSAYTVGTGLGSRRHLRTAAAGVNVAFTVAATPATFNSVLNSVTTTFTTSGPSHLAALQA
jgi:hypothetical protein